MIFSKKKKKKKNYDISNTTKKRVWEIKNLAEQVNC